jgi:hypothetical protein
MQVYVENGLSGIGIAIHHGTITTLGNTCLPGDLLCRQVHLAHKLAMMVIEVIQGTDMLLWYNQHMNGSLGIDVPEGKDLFIFKDDIRLYCAFNHFTKQTI